MKRLWALVSVAILLMGILGVFDAPKAQAQGIDRVVENGAIPSQGTYAYFYNQAIAVLEATTASLNDLKTPYNAPPSTPEKTRKLNALTKNLEALSRIQDIYITEFDRLKGNAVLPTQAQVEALNKTVAAFSAEFAGIDRIAEQQAIITGTNGQGGGLRKLNELITQARQIGDGQYAAGSPEANTYGNAEPVRTAGTSVSEVVKNADAAKCKITQFSLVDCVDVLLTSIIKKTLLQMAGFFVWLSANLLNYSIQVSIFEFKNWAPDSLYPLWIIVRQIVSLLVVFAGLYLGFMYIIGRTEAFGKYVGWLILFALFVNFSYPFSRALVDVSNIVSLNVYSAAVGGSTLTTNFSSAVTTIGGDTAGAIIMNKLGLHGLAASATSVETSGGGFVKDINSIPAALLAVVFVFYAAYIFFMATALIVMRTIVLVFLIVASPLLLVDSVIPKLGEAAMKMRKMFFEQLVLAPVFMLMLALTLKFMDVFQVAGRVNGAIGGPDSVKMFFSVLMMLIMLHIMLKVTKSVAGQAGEYATNFMGKVGGFGLAAATGGAGLLARGTIGAGAARLRDSAWMDKLQGSAAGRGLYTLSHSLAQSTYDARNVGMINKGMAKAGLTGGFGMSMQKATVRNFDDARTARVAEVEKKAMTIKDDVTRASYLAKANRGRLVRIDNEQLKETGKSIEDKKQKQLEEMMATTDPRKRETLINQAVVAKDYAMADKLRAGEAYHNIDNNNPQAAQQKSDTLKKMGIDNAAAAKELLKKDPFKDIADAHDGLVKQLQEDAAKINRKTPEGEAAYRDIQAKIGEENASFRQKTEQLRKDTLAAFAGNTASTPTDSASTGNSNKPASGGSDFSPLDSAGKTKVGPGGSDTAKYEDVQYEQPAVFRAANANFPPKPNTPADTVSGEQVPGFLLSGPALKAYNERRRAAKVTSTVGPSVKPASSPVNPEGATAAI